MCCEMYMYIYALPFPLKFYFIWLSIVGCFILALEFYPTTEVACGFLFFCVLCLCFCILFIAMVFVQKLYLSLIVMCPLR
jgi:uncharacterized membrane protein